LLSANITGVDLNKNVIMVIARFLGEIGEGIINAPFAGVVVSQEAPPNRWSVRQELPGMND
jgi:hypothetical protein